MRIDKWLWHIRAFRTRSKSATACRAGKVRLNGQAVKPATSVKPGDVIEIKYPRLTKSIEVVALLPRRVKYAEAVEYYKDNTSPNEYRRLKKQPSAQSLLQRERGMGRPTKKERRKLNEMLKELGDPPKGANQE